MVGSKIRVSKIRVLTCRVVGRLPLGRRRWRARAGRRGIGWEEMRGGRWWAASCRKRRDAHTDPEKSLEPGVRFDTCCV